MTFTYVELFFLYFMISMLWHCSLLFEGC